MAELFDTTSLTGTLLNWLFNPLMWIVILILFLLAIVMFLNIRRRRRFKYTAIEFIESGNSNAINILKAGWLGKDLYLRGLFWTGRQVMRTNALEEILNFSEEDFQIINGKRAICFYRHPISRHLVPINKLSVLNKEALAEIPPAEYVDASLDHMRQVRKENADWKTQIAVWAVIGLVIMFSLVSVIVITQYVGKAQEEASNTLKDARAQCAENVRQICAEICAVTRGTSP